MKLAWILPWLTIAMFVTSPALAGPAFQSEEGFSLTLPEDMVISSQDISAGAALVATTPRMPGGFPTLTAMLEPGPWGEPGEALGASSERVLQSYRKVGLSDALVLTSENLSHGGAGGPLHLLKYQYQGVERCSVVSITSNLSRHLILTLTGHCGEQAQFKRSMQEVASSVVLEGEIESETSGGTNSRGSWALLIIAVLPAAGFAWWAKKYRKLPSLGKE